MIKNVFLVAYRTLLRNRTYAFLNISGLSIGLSCVITIFIVVSFELSFDNFHQNSDHIFRIISGTKTGNSDFQKPGVPYPFSNALKIDKPDIKSATILIGGDNQITILNSNNTKYKDKKGLVYAGSDFFQIFKFSWLYGDAKSLDQPGFIALNESTANQYFGNWNQAIGQIIQIDQDKVYTVGGIIKDPPSNTDFQFKIIASYSSLNRINNWNEIWSNRQSYILLPNNVSKNNIESFLSGFANKNFDNSNSKHYFLLEPLSDVHRNSNFLNFLRRSMPIAIILILTFIGGFLLLIACINYVNLSTAQSFKRGKEIGIRKVLGSSRSQLILFYIFETLLIILIAVILAIVFSFLFLPFIKSLIGIPDSFNGWNQSLILFIIAIIIFCTVFSGLYPAFLIARFNPVSSLKNQVVSQSGKSINLRQTLVILQFVISQILIICTFIMIRQMNFINKMDLGFDKEAVIVLPIPNDSVSVQKFNVVKQQLLGIPSIKYVSFSNSSPFSDANIQSKLQFDQRPQTEDFEANIYSTDNDFFKTYKMLFLAGRPLAESDTANEFVVNEEMIHKLNVQNPKSLIGKFIKLEGQSPKLIVGVIKNFHQNVFTKITPVILTSNIKNYRFLNIKVQMNSFATTISNIKSICSSAFPKDVFEYHFLDSQIKYQYEALSNIIILFNFFTVVAIIIACLGVYGLISYDIIQKTKETAIRRVLGASLFNIISLFTKNIIKLILVALLISVPLIIFIMSNLLQLFVYRTSMPLWIFLVGGAATILLALFTVIFKILRAALSNTVKNLRTQ